MSTSYDVINLSKLPVPDAVIPPNLSTIFTNWLEYLRLQDPEFDALVESDPVYKQGEANAYYLLMAYQRVNDAVRAVLLASARGSNLDQLGANLEVERLMIDPGDPTAIPPIEPTYENDDVFRERIQLSWSKLSVAGPRNAYRYFSRSADADVLDAEAYGPSTHGEPGRVKVYVLSRTGNGAAPSKLVDIVDRALSADDVRPLTDYVTVESAVIAPYNITAVLEVPEGPDRQTVYDLALSTLENYVSLAHRVGNQIPISAIYAALHQPGVARVVLDDPGDDISPAAGVAPWCQSFHVSMTEADADGD